MNSNRHRNREGHESVGKNNDTPEHTERSMGLTCAVEQLGGELENCQLEELNIA